jgi:hypothetical protein
MVGVVLLMVDYLKMMEQLAVSNQHSARMQLG